MAIFNRGKGGEQAPEPEQDQGNPKTAVDYQAMFDQAQRDKERAHREKLEEFYYPPQAERTLKDKILRRPAATPPVPERTPSYEEYMAARREERTPTEQPEDVLPVEPGESYEDYMTRHRAQRSESQEQDAA